jgi:hypothetical protein
MTVFLVGTGAEQNAWPPVTEAIKAIFPDAQKDKSDGGWENFVMAKLVAVHRAQEASKKFNEGHGETQGRANLDLLRQEIATRLRKAVASKDLCPRPKFLEVAKDLEWGSRVFLTTNWDLSIEGALPNADVRHIHGSVADPATLYLPSDYAFDASHPEETRKSMLLALDGCIETFWEATTVVIYGLSLDPLDGELAAICSTGFQAKVTGDAKLERIVIYDLPEKEQILTSRVRWLHPTPDTASIEFRSVK